MPNDSVDDRNPFGQIFLDVGICWLELYSCFRVFRNRIYTYICEIKQAGKNNFTLWLCVSRSED